MGFGPEGIEPLGRFLSDRAKRVCAFIHTSNSPRHDKYDVYHTIPLV